MVYELSRLALSVDFVSTEEFPFKNQFYIGARGIEIQADRHIDGVFFQAMVVPPYQGDVFSS